MMTKDLYTENWSANIENKDFNKFMVKLNDTIKKVLCSQNDVILFNPLQPLAGFQIHGHSTLFDGTETYNCSRAIKTEGLIINIDLIEHYADEHYHSLFKPKGNFRDDIPSVSMKVRHLPLEKLV